jgi:phosphotransacetylase
MTSIPAIVTRLRNRSASNPRRIVYPESGDPRVLRAAARIVAMKMAKPILVGGQTVIERKAGELGVPLAQIEIVDPASGVLDCLRTLRKTGSGRVAVPRGYGT